MSSSPLKHRYAGRLCVNCDLLMLTLTPSVPIQFVIPRVEDRDKSWWIKSGIVYKERSFGKYRFKSKFEFGFVRSPQSLCRIVFFKDICSEIRGKPWLPCYLRLIDTVLFLWFVNLFKTIVIIYRTCTTWFSIQSFCLLYWCTLQRGDIKLKKKRVTITVPQWVCGLLKLAARNDEYYFICCWFFHWPSSTGPSLRCVVVLYAIL